ncbi:MAG TPA: WbqC family protein [Burkholderiales bacterium]|nr:WbqC family protein [Burkholderiales bacterium]
MIVTIHQPLLFPWLGYLDRMARADLFVVLDHVQFERGNYQNRARYLHEGEPRWLTVPVHQRSQKERILDKEVDHGAAGKTPWGPAAFNTLRQAYRDAPFFHAYAEPVEAILKARWTRLADLTLASMRLAREAFRIDTPMIRSSELAVHGAKSDLVLAICKAVGASKFLGGMGGSRRYLDAAAFERAGIAVEWQEFAHPVYSQRGAKAFVPGLSSLDLLFNCGPLAREILFRRAAPLAVTEEPA